MKPQVLITNYLSADHLGPLEGLAEIIQGPDDDLTMSRREVLARAAELEGIINHGELRTDTELLDAAPKLKIIANLAAGIENLDPDLLARRGVWATNTPDAFTEAPADCTLALLLALARRIAEGDHYIRSGAWSKDGIRQEWWEGSLLSGKTLGIVGFGRIGQEVARRAEAFGMKIVYYNRSARQDPRSCSLDELVTTADVISLHVPLTDQTHHLFDGRRLAQMKPGAFLVNMARGPVVDEAALVQALGQGRLGGAALDVFEKEPEVHPDLLTIKNVVLVPHIGGATQESRRQARLTCAQNVAEVLKGNKPITPVNDIARFQATQ